MKLRRITSKLVPGAVSLLLILVISSGMALAVARGYGTDDGGLRPGMVVALSTTSTADDQKVERATLDDVDRIVGITVTPDESDVTIASAAQTVFVESTGEADAYVSDLDGVVRKGDLLTISPLEGVLTKGHSGSRLIIGIALEDFIDKTKDSHVITTVDGERGVQVARLRINLDRQGGSGQPPSKPDSSLERLGESIVGKEVSEIRMAIALIIFFIVLIAEGSILYGAISSAITSLGRNPLATHIIKHELWRVVLIAVVVLMFGLAAIYGILGV